jgi:uncharacterized protein (DUF2252 family)
MSSFLPRSFTALGFSLALSGCQASLSGGSEGAGGGPKAFAERAEYVSAQIELWNRDLPPEVFEEKLREMAASPYVFYRGTNHLFWADLARDPRLGLYGGPDTRAWLQGDLHTSNFGAFDNDEGEVVFDLNDFDEALLADYQLDLWRMAASLVLSAEEIGGFSRSQQGQILDAFSEAYLDALEGFRGNDAEEGARFTENNTYGLLDDFLREVEQESSRGALLAKWTSSQDGERAFDLSLEDLAPVDEETALALEDALFDYGPSLSGGLPFDPGYFSLKSVARRLHAGVGSLGRARFYLLVEGPSADDDDDRILDVKCQPGPTGYSFLAEEDQRRYDELFPDQAERAVLGQRALGARVDDHLGWLSFGGCDYTVRELSPHKESFPLERLTSTSRFVALAAQWGEILAAGHARADQDFDPALISTSLEKQVSALTDGDHAGFRALVREVAFGYAAQVNEDFGHFSAWYSSR